METQLKNKKTGEGNLKICGLQKTTLLDYPGKVAATIFLGGCNFRCPFCHNAMLLGNSAEELMTVEELLGFLQARAGILEGVCITGGEPTLNPDGIFHLIRSIREMGYLIKLDTNGYRPEVLKQLCEDGMVDYAAMDVKAGRLHYPEASGIPGIDISRIEESMRYLINGTVPFEFRTTVVKGIHYESDFEDIGAWISSLAEKPNANHKRTQIPYFLQGFVDSGNILGNGMAAFSRSEMEQFQKIARKYLPLTELRGI